MKYSLECKVNGKLIIENKIKVAKGSRTYILIPDKTGRLSSIKIVVEVTEPHKFQSRIEPGEGQVAAKIIIKRDRELYQEIIREFRELESVLSFDTNGCLKSIGWDAPEHAVIPETEEEKLQVSFFGFPLKKEYPERAIKLDEKTFNSIIQCKHYYVSLVVPKAFYREGMNEFHSLRYINAFYNFHFVLEDLYGKGKTRNKDVTKALKGSMEFRETFEWVKKEQIDTHERHQVNIQRFCTEEGLDYNIDGLIELLQKVRGNLHHYSCESSKHLGSPFNHEDFESMAFLSMSLAMLSIGKKILELKKTHECR